MTSELLESFLEIVNSPKFYVPIISICVAFLLMKAAQRVVNKIINKNSNKIEIKRRNTIVSLIQSVIRYIIIILALLICLSVWGFDVTGLIAGLGVVGVVGGLAIQDALKDIIMGCNIILDNYFVVGDLVTFNGFTGEVIEFGLKNTKIKNVDGIVLVVANREISNIFNLSIKNSTVTIKIPTAYEEKETKISPILTKVCEEIDKWDIATEKTEYLGIDALNDSSVDYMIRAYCRAGDQFELKRKILGLVKNEYEKHKVKIPYPQLEVHNGKNI